jgi:hypothetical protein
MGQCVMQAFGSTYVELARGVEQGRERGTAVGGLLTTRENTKKGARSQVSAVRATKHAYYAMQPLSRFRLIISVYFLVPSGGQAKKCLHHNHASETSG